MSEIDKILDNATKVASAMTNYTALSLRPRPSSVAIKKNETVYLDSRSYLIIMLITASEMLVGFLVIGVNNAPLLALCVSLLDMLPVIGVGTVLVPWSVFELLFGNFSRGIGLSVLFFVNLVVRQIIEPKILGKNLGIHPIISLVMLYLGYAVFGIFGLLLVPLFAVILNILIDKKNSSEVAKGRFGE